MTRNSPQISSSVESAPAKVWIYSNDRQLFEQLNRYLSVQHAGEIEVASLSDWNAAIGSSAISENELCIVDLRDLDPWYELMTYCMLGSEGGLRSLPCPTIGILEHGYPLEFADLGDLVLAKTILHWQDVKDWAGILAEAQARHKAKGAGQVIQRRILPGAQHQFLSYTPELFPIIDDMEIATKSNYHILVTGETGTGKTTLARLIHDLSPRKDKPFITVSCGALGSELMGSELFGHVRGAFTSADRDKLGKFEVADGGTIVLEEIDTLNPVQQARLLRVIESGEFERIGSNKTLKVDVRLIVTSNVDLFECVNRKEFRPDLYYRLEQLAFDIHPLRKRTKDLAWLIATLVQEGCRMNQCEIETIHPDYIDILRAYDWPGNIRELRNHVHRSVMFCSNARLTPTCLAPAFLRKAEEAWHASSEDDWTGMSRNGLSQNVEQAEREAIEQTLRATGFNRAKAARVLGISRVTLYNKMRKYRIQLDDDPRAGH